jgi:hypothetical protein
LPSITGLNAAKRRLAGGRIRGSSKEDIAASEFDSLWKRANKNRFDDDDLANSEELLKLLCAMVRFKVRASSAPREGAKFAANTGKLLIFQQHHRLLIGALARQRDSGSQ